MGNAEKELYIKLFQQEFEKLTEQEKENIFKELEKAGLDVGFPFLGHLKIR